jgi:hypothetical protein
MPGYWNEGEARIPWNTVDTARRRSALLCGLQNAKRVVQCDAPAEERCRGVNNTEAAPRITDLCKDPQNPASCYAEFGANGCGQVYAGRSPLIADPILLLCRIFFP